MINVYKGVFACFLAGTTATFLYIVYLLIGIEEYNEYITKDPGYLSFCILLFIVFAIITALSFINIKICKIRKT